MYKRQELEYRFTDHAPESVLSPDGVQRTGSLFLNSATGFGYTGERDRYRNPIKARMLHRLNSNTGLSRLSVAIDDPDRPYSGPAEEQLDVSGDGFWEPVATFGDWDRWFVRDRPGVKLFD